jgi:thiol-disulfide isomerase/thioredoxin
MINEYQEIEPSISPKAARAARLAAIIPLVAIVIGLFGLAVTVKQARNVPASDFTVHSPYGSPVHLSDYKGRVVVLDFWASWCGPCEAAAPHIDRVARRYRDKKVAVLAINVWDTPGAYTLWLAGHPQYNAVRYVRDNGEGSAVVTNMYGVGSIPTQVVIGKDGKVAGQTSGAGGSGLEDIIEGALAR